MRSIHDLAQYLGRGEGGALDRRQGSASERRRRRRRRRRPSPRGAGPHSARSLSQPPPSLTLPPSQNPPPTQHQNNKPQATTLPLDTAKVKLQLQAGGETKYRGLLGTCATVAREEGISALYKGLEPGLHRQVINGGLRIGLYDPVKQLIVGKDHVGDVPLWGKIGAGLATGAIAITVASPTDLVKVRMQGEGKLPPGVPRRYSSAMAAYGIIAREDGVLGLWKGLGPNVARNAIINAAELASYDQIKQSLLATGVFKDNVVTHLVSGLGAGFFAVSIGSPVDVVKSRVMGESLFVLGVVGFGCGGGWWGFFANNRNRRRVHNFPAGDGNKKRMGRPVSHHARGDAPLALTRRDLGTVRTVAHLPFCSPWRTTRAG